MYPVPQATGQYRFILGGGTVVGNGGWLSEDEPTAAEKSGMTQAQVRARGQGGGGMAAALGDGRQAMALLHARAM